MNNISQSSPFVAGATDTLNPNCIREELRAIIYDIKAGFVDTSTIASLARIERTLKTEGYCE